MLRTGTFAVNHKELYRGVYQSRVDRLEGGEVITVDLRLCAPYRDFVLSSVQMHSLEHVWASRLEEYLRDNPLCKKLYVGPMGCATGFYFVLWVSDSLYLSGAYQKYILKVLMDITEESITEVPFNSKEECGNCHTLAVTEYDLDEVNSVNNRARTLCGIAYVQDRFDEYPYL